MKMFHQVTSVTYVTSPGFHSEVELQREPLRFAAPRGPLGGCLVRGHRGVQRERREVGPHDASCAQSQGGHQQGCQGRAAPWAPNLRLRKVMMWRKKGLVVLVVGEKKWEKFTVYGDYVGDEDHWRIIRENADRAI